MKATLMTKPLNSLSKSDRLLPFGTLTSRSCLAFRSLQALSGLRTFQLRKSVRSCPGR